MLANLLRKSSANLSSTSLSDLEGVGSYTLGSKSITHESYMGNTSKDDHPRSLMLSSSSNILDHMSDDLKSKLFASKDLQYSNNSNNLVPNTTQNSPRDTFRLLIVEETGQMASRNSYRVVVDFVNPKGSFMEQIRPNELKEYIFGSPLRSTEATQTDKFRTIPTSNVLMVIRTFYIYSKGNRLAICLCVPAVLLPVVTEAWAQISNWLDSTQSSILSMINKVKLTKVASPCSFEKETPCLVPTDIKLHFVPEFENIVQGLQRRLVPYLISISETPRLFLYPVTISKYIESWFKDVFYWIDVKDGPSMNFLTTLLAKVILDFRDDLVSSDTTRVTIMSENMVVANKLIFILSGVLEPKYKLDIDLESSVSSVNEKMETLSINSSSSSPKTYVEKSSLVKYSPRTCAASPSSSRFYSTSKGWEIPTRTTTQSVASLSSGESFAEVIQPSSVKSGNSSLHQLYASLSSNYPSSYGSWYKQRSSATQHAQHHSPIPSDDSWERVTNMQRTNSGSSFHQFRSGFGIIPQPSPSISEYDEYPWFGTPGSSQVEATAPNNFISNVTFGNISTSIPITSTTAISNTTISSLPDMWSSKANPEMFLSNKLKIERDFQRISEKRTLDEAFEKMCESTTNLEYDFAVTPGNRSYASVLEIEIWDSDCGMKPKELLPRYTTYLKKYNSWFKLQAFPAGSESEYKVIASMKKDMQTSDHSKTLLVALTSREIKEISMKKNNDKLLQKEKKLFHNGKPVHSNNATSIELINCISFIEITIKKALETFKETSNITKEQRAEKLLQLFQNLLNYKVLK